MFEGRSIVFAGCVASLVGCATQATPGKDSPARADAGIMASHVDGGGAPIDGSGDGSGGTCGAASEGGSCDGDTLTFCDQGMVVTVHCTEEGAPPCQCQMDYCDCGDGSSGGPDGGTGTACGTLTDGGDCQGTVVRWCEAGMAAEFDCAEVGATCACMMGYCDCTG
jgi:hypothetical protein